MVLCDFLANYLTRTYLTDTTKDHSKKESSSSSTQEQITLSDNPFAHIKPANKKTDEVFLQMGKGKQTRPRTESKKTTLA
jgi:hypothetical protein